MKDEFRKFLKRGGRSPNAIKRMQAYIQEFEDFLTENCGRDLEAAEEIDLGGFVAQIEEGSQTSAKGHLWGLGYNFEYAENENLRFLARVLREQRIERRPLPIRKFRGLDPVVLDRLQAEGIKHVKQVLAAGATPQARADLAARADVPAAALLEIVKLADLARIPGVKGIRARLYYDAGVDTLEKLAGWEPEPLREMLAGFVARSGFKGIPPLPAEIRYSIDQAKQLPKVVDY